MLITMGLLFRKDAINVSTLVGASGFLVSGILLTHLFRYFILRFHWLKLKVVPLIPLVLAASILMGIVFLISDYAVDLLLGQYIDTIDFWSRSIKQLFSFSIYFFFWSVIYFGFHFFERAREQEIKNIRLTSSKNEVELLNLRTQLNPHFMFNSMNSIRALIDEDPERAKSAITKLSNLLRSTLLAGKKDLLPFEEELEIVRDYLDLEKIRFEERLDYNIEIESELQKKPFPPLLLQTLVENAVKHGISNLSAGGEVKILAQASDERMIITVTNSGSYKPGSKRRSTGIGLENSIKRLSIMFGGRAMLEIGNENGIVKAQIELPLNE